MPKRKAQKASTDTSFLSQLELLRNFVGSSFSENDLSGCLRQCGFNIQQAAEQLITGEYNKGNNNKAGFNTPSVTKTPTNNKNKRPRVTPANTEKKVAPNSNRFHTQKRSLPESSVANSNSAARRPPDGLWLCERWIVGLSTTKNGCFQYQERLELSHSSTGPAMVRFHGSRIEGTLRPNISALLTPLLREESPLLCMEAHALMEERGVPIGGDVPICLRIYISDPVAFFRIFESHEGSAESAASQFFASAKKNGRPRKQPSRLPLAEAAFALLQWAQYGDDPKFEPPDSKEAVEDDSSDSASDELSILNEDDFEAASNEEKEAEEWAKNVVDETSTVAKESELPEADDPAGFTDDVVLRPYQRQALYWMLQRENENKDRKELEKELTLLAELSRNKSHQLVMDPPKQAIVCEVGPVRVSQSMAQKSCTIDGVENPVNHPLWQRRFLASADKTRAISFYVNELLGTASSRPPNPPRQCAGGILADAMGLGKTIMLLALILKDNELGSMKDHDEQDGDVMIDDNDDADKKLPARKEGRPTLVVAPLSLILQWEEEMATKTNLKHLVYYGESAKGGIHSMSFKGLDVVVTTYGTIQGELLASKSKSGLKGPGLLSYEWRRVILDESHCIKNPATAVSRACCMLKAGKRWCVTGTPIQNSLQDVYALIKFLKHEPWCEHGFWKAAITNASTEGNGDDEKISKTGSSNGVKNEGVLTETNISLNRVKRILAPLILRRTKDTLSKDGQPILMLPPTETITVNVEFSTAEREFYNSLLEKSQSVFEGFIKSGTASKSWMAIFSLLNRLRQTCDHVALTVKSHLDDDEWNPASLEMSSPSKSNDKSPKRTPKKHSSDKDALGQAFLDGLLEKFRTNQDTVETTYASQMAHALAKTIKSSSTTMEDECPICLDCPLIEDTVITPCAHAFCRDCLVGILKNNASSQESSLQCPNGTCPSCNETIDAKDIITLSRSPEDETVTTSYLLAGSPAKPMVKDEPKTHHVAARQTLEKALRGAGSSKLTAVISELHKVWEQDPRSKVLIYSQYLGFLDLLQAALDRRSIPTGRLDGKLSLKERVSVLEKFRQDTSDNTRTTGSVLLMSMKAGGVGINMVAASSVFICDPWWNEAVQDQCIARVHRIGQMASVVRVRKFVVKDSVEEQIVELQRRKRNISCAILSDANNDGALSNNTTPTLEDFKILFGASTS